MSRVIRHVVPVSQPQGSNLCWAAVVAMIVGRSGSDVVNQIRNEAVAANVPLYANGTLNETTGVPGLATAFHLRCDNVGTGILPGQDLADRLTRGPIGLFGLLTPPPSSGSPRHAVAAHGVTGDFAASSSSMILGVDPRGFSAINMTFFNFQTQFNISQILYRA